MVLGAFLLTHFGNHALGLVSVDAMERARGLFNDLWRSIPGTVLLYGSLALHFALTLQALFRRRTLRMPLREAAQLILGLALPILLIGHVVGTRIEFVVTGREAGYPDVIRNLFIRYPGAGVRQSVALVVAWLHGCLGIYFWLRIKPWFGRYAALLYTGALLVPVLALLGFAEAGKEIAEDPDRFTYTQADEDDASLDQIRAGLYGGFLALVGGVLVGRGVRFYRARSTSIRIAYPGRQTVTVPRGYSVLEASRMAGIAHPSACGGRGRCSTCRIRVIAGLEGQPKASPEEAATLGRIGAGPEVRLACQMRPVRDLTVVAVLSAHQPGLAAVSGSQPAGGRERDLAVLFCDLRGFTQFTEDRLPFDTVFLLNRYFEIVGHAVENTGGHLDKFIGDGALALFGVNASLADAARQAFEAALRIIDGVRQLSEAHASELDHPLRVVVSLHAGSAILGEMGYGQSRGLTAVGDTINVASRLETLAKELDVELVVSAELARQAGLDLSAHDRRTVTVRGRGMPVDAWIIGTAGAIARG